MTAATTRPEGVVASSAFALAAQLTSSVFTAGVTLYLVRTLGPSGYGALALVLSVSGIVVVVADFAVAQSTGRYAAATLTADPDGVGKVLAAGLRLKLLVSVSVATILALTSAPVAAAYGDPELVWPLRAAALVVVSENLVILWMLAFQSLRRVALTVRLLLLESLAEAVAIVSLVAMGAGVTGAVYGRAIGYAVGAAAGLLLVVRLVGRLPMTRRSTPQGREIAAYARPLSLTSGLYALYAQVDVQLVGTLLGRTALGLYVAPLRLAVLLNYPGQALANAVAPRMAGSRPDAAVFSTALRWLLLYQTAVLAPVVFWAEPAVVLLLGEQFRDSAPVLSAFAPWVWLSGLSMLASTTVNYLGLARRRIPVVVLSLLLNALLCALLLPRIGVLGAVVALTASYAVYVPWHVKLCRECFPLPLRPQALVLLRAGLAAVAFGLVLHTVGSSPSWQQWLAGALLGPAAYVAVLVLTGELTAADRRQAWRLATSVRNLVRR